MQVRRATPADDAAVIELIGELQSAQAPADRHRWLYRENPAGRALTWLAIVDGQVAGLTSFFPFRLINQSVYLTGALGGDGFVRAAFRRRGIGAALHAASRADMVAAGIACMYGAPGAMNVTPLLQGGSVRVGDVTRLVRPGLIPAYSRARLEPMRAGDPRVDQVWRDTARELGVAAVRDARFYQWRFLDSPSQKQVPHVIGKGGRAIGVCALERVGARVRLLDLTAPARAWGSCLRAIAMHTRRADLEMKLAARDATRRRLWMHGFMKRDDKPFLVMVPEGATGGALLDPRAWFYTQADSDLDAAE